MLPGADASRCADRSAARGESLVATASRYRSWLLLEQPGPWGHDGLVQSDLPLVVGTRLRALGRRLRIRVLLIKRREPPREGRRCFLIYSGARERQIRSFEVEGPAALLDLDLAAWAERRFDEVGEPVDGPLYLVCTHGKHDPCCARRGGPLYRALSALPNAWECTHIGGDRFAGNLVCFPHGLYFGRVGTEDGPRVAQAYAEGRIELDLYRGHAAFSPPVQAAENLVRTRHDLSGVDDLVLVAHEDHGLRHRVEFDHAGSRHVVELEAGELAPQLLTCKSITPHPIRSFEGVELPPAHGV
jgi:hypothetical protein